MQQMEQTKTNVTKPVIRVVGMIQHKVNYDIKNGIKNTSPWRQLLDTLKSDSQCNIMNVATQFANQLKIDEHNMSTNNDVTECALVCPSRRSHHDKLCGIGKMIAKILFPVSEEDEMKDKPPIVHNTWMCMQYQRLLSKLRACYKTQLKNKMDEKHAYTIARMNDQRHNFCTLKKRDISYEVSVPEPMPVEVASFQDLEPFFNHVKQNIKCEPKDSKDYIEFKRGAYYMNGRIDMCKQVVGEPWIRSLTESIKSNPWIEHFLLGNNIVDTEGAEAIAEFITKSKDHPCHIKTWYIAGNLINSHGVGLIAEALSNDHYAESLWLKRNPLMPDGMMKLGEMLKKNKSLQILDLHNVACFDQGASFLFDGLKENRTLDILYLDANGITSEGTKFIASYFDHLVEHDLKGLGTLYCGVNRLDDEGAIILAQSLKNYKHLERLILGSNRITYTGADAIFNALTDHQKLIVLDLGMYKSTSDLKELPNNLGDQSVPSICNFIKNNKSVKIFSIIHNDITVQGLELIADVLESNHTILNIAYEQYGLEIPVKLRQKLTALMERNINDSMGIHLGEFNNKYARNLRHGDKIKFIDSIYRNKM